ncbi:hypothetical protein ACSSVZ_004119 [Amorphus sp. MBR-141]
MLGRVAGILVATLTMAGCMQQQVGQPGLWYAANQAVLPTATRVVVCHGFGCVRRTPVTLSAKNLRTYKTILARGRSSPAAERKAIAEAIAWMEKTVAPTVGSENDVAGLDLRNAGVVGQMDCIDESTNTTSYLLLAEKQGFLVHHTVVRPVARGFFLDGRYPHATAVVDEIETGRPFAIDSWPHANGERPDVMPLEEWFAVYPLLARS